MTESIQSRLTELGITLPKVVAPIANYLPYTRAGQLVFVSGQLPMLDGSLLHTGKVGEAVDLEQGDACARQCALNVVAQVQAACGGDLDRVQRVVKITGFVASPPSFTDHPSIVNGASDILVEIFGDIGRHARAAVGCPALPLDAPVEVEAVFEVS